MKIFRFLVFLEKGSAGQFCGCKYRRLTCSFNNLSSTQLPYYRHQSIPEAFIGPFVSNYGPRRIWLSGLSQIRFIETSSSRCSPKTNYYSVLKISPKATAKQIKTAFYRLSVIHHPDKNRGSPEAQKKFSEISEAYNILGNEAKRKEYDLELNRVPVGSTSFHQHGSKFTEFRERGLDHRYDVWTKQHYSNARLRRKRSTITNEEFNKNQQQMRDDVTNRRMVVISSILVMLCLGGMLYKNVR